MALYRLARSLWKSVLRAIGSDPELRGLLQRHPRAAGFFRKRLDRSTFGGLSLTLLGALLLYLVFLLLGTVEDLVTADPLVAADTRIDLLLAGWRTESWTRLFLGVTALGSWPCIFGLAVILSLVAWAQRRLSAVPPFALALLGGAGVTFLGKLAFHRPRPPLAAYLEPSFSFPSGHACLSVTLYGFALYLLWGRVRGKAARTAAFLGTALLVLGIAFSRLYLGVHYASDVWGGLLLGLLWLIAGITAAEWIRQKPSPEGPPPAPGRLGGRAVPALLLAGVSFAAVIVLRFSPPLLPLLPAPPSPLAADALTLFTDGRLPARTETIAGRPEEPLSFLLLVPSDEALVDDFGRAGWLLAEKPTPRRMASLALRALANLEDPAAPMTPSFWNGAPHDLGFEKPVPGKGIRQRHHARFWRTGYLTPSGMGIFVGTASLDTGFKWGITHRISPDIDAEREVLAADLEAAGVVRSSRRDRLVAPLMGTNFTGDPFFTDGQVLVLELGGGHFPGIRPRERTVP